MIPNGYKLLTCPHCGNKKKVINLMSGNTCGASLWSDAKHVTPMLPKISYVQQCPSCKHYFLFDKNSQREEINDDYKSFCLETGNLSYQQLKEAYVELSNDKIIDEFSFRIMLIWGYNDVYYKQTNIPKEEYEYFVDNVRALLPLMNDNDIILTSELHREIGEFDEAIKIIENNQASNEFIQKVQQQILERSQIKDSKVFLLYGKDRI